MYKSSSFSTSSSTFYFLFLFIFFGSVAMLTGVRWYVTVVLICISVIITDTAHLFIYTCWLFVCLLWRNICWSEISHIYRTNTAFHICEVSKIVILIEAENTIMVAMLEAGEITFQLHRMNKFWRAAIYDIVPMLTVWCWAPKNCWEQISCQVLSARKQQMDTRKLGGVEYAVTVIVWMVLQSFAYVQTHQLYMLNMCCSLCISHVLIQLDKVNPLKAFTVANVEWIGGGRERDKLGVWD